DALKRTEGVRQVPGRVAVPITVVGLDVKRDEVDRDADLPAAQLADELVAIDPQRVQLELDDVEVPGVAELVGNRRHAEPVEPGERLMVTPRDQAATGVEFVAAPELGDADRG